MSKVTPSKAAIAELTSTGILRTGINLSNFLLVTGTTAAGDPVGVAPDMALEIANRLGVPVQYFTFKTPAELADKALSNVWDIGLIGAEPQRAEMIAFSPAYVEIEATYLVPAGSPLKAIADVDKAGVRIAVTGKTAYGLWLDNNIKQATLHRSASFDTAFDEFTNSKLEALAGLRPGLIKDLAKLPGSRLIEGFPA
jgi:polar amino acid transport system substrate-binding protein